MAITAREVRITLKLVRYALSRKNLDIFGSDFSTFRLPKPKVTEIWFKKDPDFSHLVAVRVEAEQQCNDCSDVCSGPKWVRLAQNLNDCNHCTTLLLLPNRRRLISSWLSGHPSDIISKPTISPLIQMSWSCVAFPICQTQSTCGVWLITTCTCSPVPVSPGSPVHARVARLISLTYSRLFGQLEIS